MAQFKRTFLKSLVIILILSACGVPITTNSSDMPRYNQLKAEVDLESAALKALESELTEKDNDLSNLANKIDELKAQLRIIEGRFPSKILPTDIYHEYETIRGETNRLVDLFNEELHNFKLKGEIYNLRIDSVNAKVDEANNLAPRVKMLLFVPRKFKIK